jgi:hypothetical protein
VHGLSVRPTLQGRAAGMRIVLDVFARRASRALAASAESAHTRPVFGAADVAAPGRAAE